MADQADAGSQAAATPPAPPSRPMAPPAPAVRDPTSTPASTASSGAGSAHASAAAAASAAASTSAPAATTIPATTTSAAAAAAAAAAAGAPVPVPTPAGSTPGPPKDGPQTGEQESKSQEPVETEEERLARKAAKKAKKKAKKEMKKRLKAGKKKKNRKKKVNADEAVFSHLDEDYLFRSAGVVIKIVNTPVALAFLKHRIVRSLLRADLRFGLAYTIDMKYVLCTVYANYRRLLVEADRQNYNLPLDPIALEKADIIANAHLQDEGFVFDFHPNPDPHKNLKNVPGPKKVLRGVELAITNTLQTFQKPREPYRHIYAKFDLPEDNSPAERQRLALFKRHKSAPLPEGGLLKSTDGLKLMFIILRGRDDGPGTGCNLKLDSWILKGKIETYSPLHDAKCLKLVADLEKAWPWNVPVTRIRRYFGEKVGMYFGFLAHFTQWLAIPAVIGTVAFLQQTATGDVNIAWLPILGVLTTLWSTLYLESWKRRQNSYAMEWGMTDFEEEETLRTEYTAHPVTFRRRSLVNGKPTFWTSTVEASKRLCISFTIVVVMILAVILAVGGIFLLRVVMVKQETKGNLPKGWGNYIVSVINSVQILILNAVYRRVARVLTEFENHSTDTSYEDSLITKTSLFQFINSYFSFFFIAFIKSANFKLFGQDQTCSPGPDGEPDCMRELQINLGVIFVSRLVVGNFTEIFLPRVIAWAKRFKNRCCGSGDDHQDQKPGAAEIEVDLPVYDPFADYQEMLLLYGYVTLFVVAFPIAPLLGLLNNVVEIRVDSFKLIHNSARPIPKGAEDIGAWLYFLDLLTTVSVFTNLGVVLFTDRTDFWGLNTRFEKVLAFILLEHAILFLKFLTHVLIADQSWDVKLQLQRQTYLVDKHVHGIEDEVDTFKGLAELGEQELAGVEKHFHIHQPVFASDEVSAIPPPISSGAQTIPTYKAKKGDANGDYHALP